MGLQQRQRCSFKLNNRIYWENAFDGKDISAQVALFNETGLNIFCNFIPNRRNKVKLNSKFYRQYTRHQTQISGLLKVEDLRNEIINLITKSKEKYYQCINAKLDDPLLSNKSFFTMVSKFLTYFCCLLILHFLPIFKKKRISLTLFSQNNACRFQQCLVCESIIYGKRSY